MKNKKYLTSRVKYYKDKFNTDFHDKKNQIRLSVFVRIKNINEVSETNKDYYSQVFLQKCKYLKISSFNFCGLICLNIEILLLKLLV